MSERDWGFLGGVLAGAGGFALGAGVTGTALVVVGGMLAVSFWLFVMERTP